MAALAGSAVPQTTTIPKYIQVVYDEGDALPSPSVSMHDIEGCSQMQADAVRLSYEIPIVLATSSPSCNPPISCNKQSNENDIPSIVAQISSNCSSLSSPVGDESMQALLPPHI